MSPVRIRYQTIEFDELDVHLRTLRDCQQFCDVAQEAENLGVAPASWPHFGVLWESGEVLARLMCTHQVRDLRVLEVGCGIGLASIVLSAREADITATDHHPQAGVFLTANAQLNGLAPIAFVRTGWEDDCPLLGRFDLIIGSDLLYEQAQVGALSHFILSHSNARCQVIIVDPGRGQRGRFVRQMVALGYAHDSSTAVQSLRMTTYRGQVIQFSRSRVPALSRSNR